MGSLPLLDLRDTLLRDRGTGFMPRARWALVAWLVCCVILLWLARENIAALNFRDPDDAMRLQQVRDWIGGQAFWDVSQHRVNPPAGGPMHWSRLVDAPIAALILLLRPLLGGSLAEAVACSLVPLLSLGVLTGALFAVTRRLGGDALALLAAVLLLASPTILVQFGPLRIDHHGWQIIMATLALCGALDRRAVHGGALAGLAIAVWLQISSEGLPYAALFGAVLAFWQWRRVEQAPRFIAFAAVLGGAALLLLLMLRGTVPLIQQQCDALSAAYVWPLAAFALATPLAFRLMGQHLAFRRLLAAGVGGGTAAATFLITGHQCLTGDPFQALGPVAYKLWYLQVMEGQPIWRQALSMMGLIVLPPLTGLAGSVMAIRSSRDVAERERWLVLAALLAGAVGVAIMVMRAMSVAHVLALPGIGWLMLKLFRRAQAQASLLPRVFGSAAVALLTPAALCALWVGIASLSEGRADSSPSLAADCRSTSVIAPLNRLPTATLFAPLDMGPDILIRTPHRVIGTAHHRNAAGITAVVEGFTATPDHARAILSRLNGGKGPDYLISCPGLNEFKHYSKEHRGSLAAMLDAGRAPDWLKPVLLKGTAMRVYRVMPPRS